MNLAELEAFDQKVVSVKCGGCGNHCQLTINTFADGRKFISGNRCDKPVTGKSEDNSLNLYVGEHRAQEVATPRADDVAYKKYIHSDFPSAGRL